MDATDVLLLMSQAGPAPRPLWGEPNLAITNRKRARRGPALRRSAAIQPPSSDSPVLPAPSQPPALEPAVSGGQEMLSVEHPRAAGAANANAIAIASAPASASAPEDPLAVARGLDEAARLQVWLSVAELAALLRLSVGTVRGWRAGHRPRPGFVLERCKKGAAVWWLVKADG